MLGISQNQLSSDSWAVGFEEAEPCSAFNCQTINGSGSKIYCPARKAMSAAMQLITGCSLMRFFNRSSNRGIPWRDLPARFGEWTSCTSGLTDDQKSGVFERIFKLLASDSQTTNT